MAWDAAPAVDRGDPCDPEQAATSISGDLFTLGREDYLLVGDTGAWGLAHRGGALRGQCVLGVSPRLREVAARSLEAVLAEHGAPEVLAEAENAGS